MALQLNPSCLEQADILAEVVQERERQDAKWGEQNHNPVEWITVLAEEVGEASQGALRAHFGGKPTAEYREEMIQVAAVAIAAIESLGRQEGR